MNTTTAKTTAAQQTTKITVKAGAKVQNINTGAWAKMPKDTVVTASYGKYGSYRFRANGAIYSVDYKDIIN